MGFNGMILEPGDRVWLSWPDDTGLTHDELMDLLQDRYPQVEFRVYVGPGVTEPKIVFVYRDKRHPFIETDDATSYVGVRER